MASTPHSLNVARAAGALWKFRLRRSVRLLLALREPGDQQQVVAARLRLVERQLVLHLLRPKPDQRPLVTSMPRARAIVELAQITLLSSGAMVAAIRAEFSAVRAIDPVKEGQYKPLF